jgi:LmbE family N-acetylglucosaminyl deacetylase
MDDEVLACGGTLAQLPHKRSWHVAYASDGMASPEPIIAWRDYVSSDLGAVRRDEARNAMTSLGIPETNLHFFDLPDGRLQKHRATLRRMLDQLIATLQPEHVLVPFRYDRHPDHLALNHVLTDIVDHGSYDKALTEYFVYYRWRLLPEGDVRCYVRPELLYAVDVAPSSAAKRAALDDFKSQTTRFYAWQARPNLTPALLDNVSTEPEYFLRYDPGLPGPAIFSRAVPWIRIAHRLEPFLKKRKDRLLAWWQRGRTIVGSIRTGLTSGQYGKSQE